MIAVILLLQLAALIAINVQLNRALRKDFEEEDHLVKEMTKKVSEAKNRIPPVQQQKKG